MHAIHSYPLVTSDVKRAKTYTFEQRTARTGQSTATDRYHITTLQYAVLHEYSTASRLSGSSTSSCFCSLKTVYCTVRVASGAPRSRTSAQWCVARGRSRRRWSSRVAAGANASTNSSATSTGRRAAANSASPATFWLPRWAAFAALSSPLVSVLVNENFRRDPLFHAALRRFTCASIHLHNIPYNIRAGI